MNRLRAEATTHPSFFITLILAALVVVSGGITYVVYKNAQVRTARLIDQAEDRIEQTEVKIRMIEVNTDELLDRFDMRERLEENGSILIGITPADIEEIEPPRGSPEVASARDLP